MMITKYTLMRFFKKPLGLGIACALPLLLMFVPDLWVEGAVLGGFSLVTFVILASSFITSQVILSDRIEGALTRIMMAPVSRLQYLAQVLLACMLPLIIQLVLVSGAGLLLHAWSASFALQLLLIYSLFAAASVGLAFMFYSFMKSKDSSTAGLSMLLTLMATVGGMFMPVSMFPQPIQWVARALPSFWVVEGYTQLLDYGTATGGYWLSVGVLAGFTLLFLAIGGQKKIVY